MSIVDIVDIVRIHGHIVDIVHIECMHAHSQARDGRSGYDADTRAWLVRRRHAHDACTCA
jgi:hypothetical protein